MNTERRRSYHHGDLRAALIETAIELIAERGVHGFSLAEASRRTGVAASAPYAHFADRDDLLAAVAVHAYELFRAESLPKVQRMRTPEKQLAELARAYVRFAADHTALFQTLFEAGLDKTRYPEIHAAEAPIDEVFHEAVDALEGPHEAEGLAVALEATAHGHATLLLDGRFGDPSEAAEHAAERAARATRALVEARAALSRSAGRAPRRHA